MRFCIEPNCPNVVESGRCEKHERAKRLRERRFTSSTLAESDDRYYPPVNYGRRWQLVARTFLSAHPFCSACEAKGLLTVSTQCDHRIPHRGDPSLFWDPENWNPLCAECHSTKTAREVGFTRERRTNEY